MFFFFFFLKFFLLKKTFSYCNEKFFFIMINYLKINNFELFKIRNTINLSLLKNKKNIFISHIDVVSVGTLKWKFNPFNCFCYKKKIFCRGIIDMKGGFCSFLFLSKNNNFLLTNDEESSSIYGIQYIINIYKIRKKIFYLFYGGEPTSKKIVGDYIKISRRGSYNFNIIFNGKQKHCAYLGKNIIKFALNYLIKINNNILNKKEIFEISNLLSISNGLNITPNNFLININYRFYYLKNIFFLKKKFFFFFKKKNIFTKWNWSGIPFFCYKNFYLKYIKDSIFKIQNIYPKINFLGGTSDLRYCYQFNKKFNFFEIGLLNKSIHKINEFSYFDDIYILYLIFKNFHFGIK